MKNNQTTKKTFSYKDCKGVPYTTVPKNRLDYGVVLNTIPKFVNLSELGRTNNMIQQAKDREYKGLNTVANDRVAYHQSKGWDTTFTAAKNHYLREAKCVLFITTNLYEIESDLITCWYAQTPVTIFNPMMDPDVLNLRGAYELTEYYAIRKELMVKEDYDKSFEELRQECVLLLKGYKTPWLDTPSLGHLYHYGFHQDINRFLEYIRAITDSILAEGQWDVEVTASHVQREASCIYRTKDAKGVSTLGYNERFKVFHNYDSLPIDELNLFLTLTYYKAIGMKPLQIVAFDNEIADYRPVTPDELEPDCYFYSGDEQYVTTPIYVEQEQHLDKTGTYEMPTRR